MTDRPWARTQAIIRLSVAVWLGYSRVMRVARSREWLLVACIELRSLWNVAPMALRPSVWKLIGRWPKSSPPGSAMFASPQRVSSGPSTTIDARIEANRCAGATGCRSWASGTLIESSCCAGRTTEQPSASSSSIITPTSVMSGTLDSWCSPVASRQAAICLRTAFLAPKACTSPSRGPAGLTTRELTPQVWPGSPIAKGGQVHRFSAP